MNPKPSIGLRSHLTLCSTLLIAAALWNSPAPAATPAPGSGGSAPAKAIPWTELGAAAGAQYSGDGLTVSRTEQGARLGCVFQRLEGEATREGLWLTSTEPDQPNDRFRVIAVEVGRESRAGIPLPADGAHGVTRPTRLPAIGEVSVDGQTVRFTRSGLVEEYSVSMDGVRQDFVVLEKPPLTLSLSPSDGERDRVRGNCVWNWPLPARGWNQSPVVFTP